MQNVKGCQNKALNQLPLPGILFAILCHFSTPLAGQSLQQADSLTRAGRFKESVKVYEYFIEQNPRRIYDQSSAWLGISYNYLQLGDYEEALAANDRSKAIRDQLRADDVADNYMRYGAIYLQLGAFERALANLRSAKSLPSVDTYLFALMEGYMAGAYAGMKNYPEAERHYLLSLESLSAEVGENHPDVSTGLYNLGRLYLLWGRMNDAKETLMRALNTEQRLPAHSERLGLILNALGELLWKESGHLAARSYFLRALEELESTFGMHHKEVGRTRLHLSSAALAGGEGIEAAAQVQKALQSLCPGFDANDFSQNPDPALPVLDRVLMAEAYAVKARCYAVQSPLSSLNEQLQLYAAALQLIELEAVLNQGDASRLRVVEFLPTLAGEAIAVAMRSSEPAHARLAFDWSERAKAALLRVQSAQAAASELPHIAEEKKLLQQWREAELEFFLHPESDATVQALSERQAAFFAFTDQMRTQAPLYHQANLARQTSSAATIQALLDDKTAMLSYFIGAEQYYIFALTQTEFTALALPFNHLEKSAKVAATMRKLSNLSPGNYSKIDVITPMPSLQESVKGYLSAIRRVKSDDFVFFASDLYGKLIQPVKKQLSGKNKLVVIPHDLLSYLPFEALLTPLDEEKAEKTPYHKLPYLVKTYAVQYHYAATLWAMPSVPASGDQAFAGFAPVFDEGELAEADKILFDTAYQFQPALRAVSPDGQRFQALPESEHEINAIAALFGKQPGSAGVFLRREATQSAVRQSAGRARVMHFATHSFVHEANPQLSGLALSPQGDDGILYLPEIQSLDLKGALCVLSSCDSGNGSEAKGEGVLSPAYAFFRAGAGGVIASLWQVYDRYNSRLSTEFYRQYLSNKPVPEALRQAKLSLIKDKTAAEPRKWSGMIYIGK